MVGCIAYKEKFKTLVNRNDNIKITHYSIENKSVKNKKDFVLILAEIIRKCKKYISLDMLLFYFLSWAIEKCLKFGSVKMNMKHSTNFFHKVAAPTGRNNSKN